MGHNMKNLEVRKFKFKYNHGGIIPADTGRKLNVHKTFRRRPGCLLNVLFTFNLRPVSTGIVLYLYDTIERSKVN